VADDADADAGAGASLADVANGCGAAFDGCESSCSRDQAGLDGASEAGICSVAGNEDGFVDCCAFASSVRSREAGITQCEVRIAQPRFRFCLRLRQALRKAAGSVAVVLVVIGTRRLLAWGALKSAAGGCLYSLRGVVQA